MKAWKNVAQMLDEKYDIDVCCSKLSKQTIIEKIDNEWMGHDEEAINIFRHLKHCPFCGSKLP